MTTRMLIDARHQEETRVAVVKGNKIEEFDFESSEHKQLKGNIYLAKVTRVEPSLQAAFVDYGGNRHGFLAFSEIHPDYYQIPREDREALLAEEAQHAAEEAALRAQEEEEEDSPADMVRSEATEELDTALVEVDQDESIDTIDVTEGEIPQENNDEDDDDDEDDESDGDSSDDNSDDKGKSGGRRGRGGRNTRGRGKGSMPKASDQARQKRMALRKRYKIQDVIQRRQVVLVQVVKEERGNKGAALTTYLSLAGRYCVLMPNTSHGGGISRKINNAGDRKRLKSIIADLKLPTSMGCIVRTAGLSRTKPEIKRDFDYLARLWDEIREKTLSATAPSLIHSDSDLVKRAIRDIYNREIEEVLVEGANGYTAAKNFMKLLMPSHSKRVKSYADPVSLFQRYGVEDQLSAMYSPEVQLKSGGYLVINPTEALVSIDINSGRSTREHGIEATAVKTNMEAAAEIARQLRLRDMAGLVVIDFIDMDRSGNVRKVERAMRDALKNDRARIQVGRISSFGLMEMSRQRLRTGVLEASTKVCPHCEGTGLVRTASSSALSALRLLEEEAAKGKASVISLRTSQEACIYVLNSKRHEIEDIEQRYGVSIEIVPDGETEGARMEIQTSGSPPKNMPKFEPIIDDDDDDDHVEEAEIEETEEREARGDRSERSERSDRNDGEERPKRKRRRRGRRNRGGDRPESGGAENGGENGSGDNNSGNNADNNSETAAQPNANDTDAGEQAEKPKPRSRRNNPRKADAAPVAAAENGGDEQPQAEAKPRSRRRSAKSDAPAEQPAVSTQPEAEAAEEKPKRRRAPRKAKPTAAAPAADATTGGTAEAAADATVEKKPAAKRAPRARAKKADSVEVSDKTAPEAAKEKAPAKPRKPRAAAKPKEDTAAKPKDDTTAKPKDEAVAKTSDSDATTSSDGSSRQGWWQRTFG